MTADSQLPLYLFAKAPVPGLVKTRMQPYLNEHQSAQLAVQMLKESVDKVRRFWPGKLVLTVTPNQDHLHFKALALEKDLEMEVQISGDLGERMSHVLRRGIGQYGGAMVMGCDVPHITAGILKEAHQWIMHDQNVIGPVSDGGFYILGLTSIDDNIFDQVVWGQSEVFAQVCQNMSCRDMLIHELPELRDIDYKEDLIWLAKQDQRYQGFVN